MEGMREISTLDSKGGHEMKGKHLAGTGV